MSIVVSQRHSISITDTVGRILIILNGKKKRKTAHKERLLHDFMKQSFDVKSPWQTDFDRVFDKIRLAREAFDDFLVQ